MSRAIHVLEVIYRFDSGGSERIGATLAEALAARGWTVSVAATHGTDGPVRTALAAAGIRCHGLNSERRGRIGRRWSVFRLCRRLRPDVLHAQHVSMFMLCFLPAWLAGVRRFAVTEHNECLLSLTPLARWLLRRYTVGSTRVIAIHQGVARAFIDTIGIPSARVCVIANGIDSQRFVPLPPDSSLRRLMGDDGNTVLIGCVARLHPLKDHPTLLEAFARVVDRAAGLRVHLVLIGDGEERTALEARIRERSLGERVTLLGDRSDIERLLPQLDLFVLPSRTEGLPMVLLEAMACGVPCIATRVGGVPDLLSEGGGELVEPADPEALACVLERFCRDPELRRWTGESARQRIVSGYREAAMIDAYALALTAD